MQSTRSIAGFSKTLDRGALESKLEKIIRIKGGKALNKIRDEARNLSVALHMQKEFERLNGLISALLSTSSPQNIKQRCCQSQGAG